MTTYFLRKKYLGQKEAMFLLKLIKGQSSLRL